MAIRFVLKNGALFHITHINNLPGILRRGLLSKNKIISAKIKYEDVSSDDIQRARSRIVVPGTSYYLHDCVPAFFGARPPMLLALRRKGIAQEKIIYLLINWNIIFEDTTWFTDGNARANQTKFYQGRKNVNKVDLKAASVHYWGESDEAKRKKQAEVLKLHQISLDKVIAIVVYNNSIRKHAEEILRAHDVHKKIFVVPAYYYQ